MMYSNYWSAFPASMHGTFFGLFLLPLTIWSLFWTGYALWVAARNQSKGWFIVFLLVHTAGILEIIYIYFLSKKQAVNVSSKKKNK